MRLANVDTVFRQDESRRVDHDVDILVRDGEIVAIDDDVSSDDSSGEETIDCSDRIALPGLVNCHTHTPNVITRGWSDDEPLFPWLVSGNRARKHADRDDKRAGARLSAALMLRTGTTTCNDLWNTYLVDEFEALGIRALLGPGLAEFEDTDPDAVDDGLEATRSFAREYRDHPTIHPTVPVHSVYRATESLVERAHEIASTYDLPFHIHVSETEAENEQCRRERGTTPTGWLDDCGALDERGVLAHCTHLTDADRDRLADSGAGVAHCPAANCKLGSGIADVPALERVPVGIGTDGAASNNSLNLVREGRLAALLHKRTDPAAMTAQRVLDMLTCEAAAALGMADEIGSLDVGKRADVVLLDKNDPTLRPQFGDEGVLSNLIYSFHGRVETTIVEGEVVVEDGTVVNEGKAAEKVQDAMQTVQQFCDRVLDRESRPSVSSETFDDYRRPGFPTDSDTESNCQ